MRPDNRPGLDLSLPDKRPTAPGHLPDISTALPWRTWNDGLAEAALRGMPIFAFAEPAWTNSAQRIALRLQQEDALRQTLSTSVILVLVNPNERPDLAAAWHWAAMALTGTAGPPLMVFLTHEGLPFLAYCTMAIEGDDTYPSLASLVDSVAENYETNSAQINAEARQLAERAAPEAVTHHDTWESLREQMDTRRGGLRELPKHPRPALLWALLDLQTENTLPSDVQDWLGLTLDALVRGGVWDQIDRGFHRAARDEMWAVPHFEKPVPLNAQLAAIYARAAQDLGNETYRDIASRLVSFCMAALREGIDVIGSDTGYYTWTSRELLKTLDPALVQVVTLHYDIKPVDERQALRRVNEMEQMGRFSHEDVSVLQTRLMRGRAQLRSTRLRRPAPAPASVTSLGWRATTLRWLIETSAWTDGVDVPAIVTMLETLVDGRFRDGAGYTRSTPDDAATTFWLEDQAALLSAFLGAYRATGDNSWLERGRELADTLMDSWWSGSGWLDRPQGSPSRDVIDDVLPAAITTLTASFQALAEATGDPGYAHRAGESLDLQNQWAAASGHVSALLPRR